MRRQVYPSPVRTSNEYMLMISVRESSRCVAAAYTSSRPSRMGRVPASDRLEHYRLRAPSATSARRGGSSERGHPTANSSSAPRQQPGHHVDSNGVELPNYGGNA